MLVLISNSKHKRHKKLCYHHLHYWEKEREREWQEEWGKEKITNSKWKFRLSESTITKKMKECWTNKRTGLWGNYPEEMFKKRDNSLPPVRFSSPNDLRGRLADEHYNNRREEIKWKPTQLFLSVLQWSKCSCMLGSPCRQCGRDRRVATPQSSPTASKPRKLFWKQQENTTAMSN